MVVSCWLICDPAVFSCSSIEGETARHKELQGTELRLVSSFGTEIFYRRNFLGWMKLSDRDFKSVFVH